MAEGVLEIDLPDGVSLPGSDGIKKSIECLEA
jgi:hypothetical protein